MSEYTNTTFSSDTVENTETIVEPVETINSNEIEILETHENPNGETVELKENTGDMPEVSTEELAETTESDILE